MEKNIHKLAAIVFTDIVGYTKRMEESEQNTMELLKQQREIIFPLVQQYEGEIIKELGDGLLMMFSSAIQAVRFAIEVQEKLRNSDLIIRAGIHIGDVIFEGKDVFGSAVNTAARIEPLAPPGGICISEDVMSQLRNKKEIRAVSLGKKKLKNVNDLVEIFRIVMPGEEDPEERANDPLLTDLWKRKVIHFMAAYLALFFLIRVLIVNVSGAYSLSPHLIRLSGVIMISLLPAVFILSYFHSGRKHKRWSKTEMIGLPANIVFTLLLSGLLFGGKDLGATTKTITLEDEEGRKIERVVLKNEFRKKIAVFFPENQTGNEEYEWLRYGLVTMLEYDLSQDMYMDIQTAFQFKNKMLNAGFDRGISLPVPLMQKMAEYYHKDYFVAGDYKKTGNEYMVTLRLYETGNGKLLSEDDFTGESIFDLADRMALSIKQNTGIPALHIENTRDFPLTEILTGSYDALKHYIRGYTYAIFDNDFPQAVQLLESSVGTDSGFALAHVTLAEFHFHSNNAEKASLSLQAAMDNIYKLPERMQFQTKFFYYLLKQEADKALSVIKMWVELFPNDIEGRKTLAERYSYKNMFSEAISQLRVILQIDPDQGNILLEIGNFYKAMGNYDSALYYYQDYALRFPQDYESYYSMGNLYLTSANFEKARQHFEKALLLDQGNVEIIISLARIDMRLGSFEKAGKGLFEALDVAKSHLDKTICLDAISDFYELKGQKRKSLEYFEKMLREAELSLNPMRVQVTKVFNIRKYIINGDETQAFEKLKKIESDFNPPVDKVAAFGYLFAYLELEDAENARRVIPDAEEVAKGFGEEMLLSNISYALGYISEIEGDYETAVKHYEEFLSQQPTSNFINMRIAKCYRLLGQMKKANENIAKALNNFPYHPEINFEASLISFAQGDTSKGMEYLDKALGVWSEADADFKPAGEAKARQKEMTLAG
ncbi:MAG: tetratricopeptide repeat protein [Bacteroidales bacterium]|nr:tetratricopeptide repeat protein [Bacteroidales bacterium]